MTRNEQAGYDKGRAQAVSPDAALSLLALVFSSKLGDAPPRVKQHVAGYADGVSDALAEWGYGMQAVWDFEKMWR